MITFQDWICHLQRVQAGRLPGALALASSPAYHTRRLKQRSKKGLCGAIMLGLTILPILHQRIAQRRFEEAEQLALEATQQTPDDPAAWEGYGDALRGLGKSVAAEQAYQRAWKLAPSQGEARYKQALVLIDLGRTTEAIGLLREALVAHGEHVGCLLQLGTALAQTGALEEALGWLDRAVSLRPHDAQLRHNWGVALAQAGKLEEARQELERAVHLDGSYAAAWANLGSTLHQLQRDEEAAQAYRRCLALQPLHARVSSNLGQSLFRLGRPAEGVMHALHAVRVEPQVSEFHNALGLLQADLGRHSEAIQSFDQALRLKPDAIDAHVNLANALKDVGRDVEALACYEIAQRLGPEQRSTRYNRSLLLLLMGRWEEGWREYEYRWGRKTTPERPFNRPRWRGADPSGQTVLVWCEQGLGDILQFLRYLPLLKARGARTVVECPGYLFQLLSTFSGIDQLVAEGAPLPPLDCQIPLMSLPGAFGTTIDHVPAAGPYLQPQPERMRRWKEKLGTEERFRIGIVWQGNPYLRGDPWRSAPLERFAPLAALPQVELISLQKNFGLDQLDRRSLRFPVRAWTEELDAEGGFLDTAAILPCLDLVVCVDTGIGHLAGTLGVPVWLALSTVADWRWLRDREDTPWYPHHRLFRQEVLGDWKPVFARMAHELERFLNLR